MKRLAIILLSSILLLSCSNPSEPVELIKEKKKELVQNEVIVFSSDRNSSSMNLFIMHINGDSVQQLTNLSNGNYVPSAISPDGKLILFYSSRWSNDFDSGSEIFLYDCIENKSTGPIAYGTPGNFSPDGKKFVYCKHIFTKSGGYDSIWLYDLETNTEVMLSKPNNHRYSPNLSYDGKTIIYAETNIHSEMPYYSRIHLMDLNGNDIKSLTPLKSSNYAIQPKFIPNSNKIVFIYLSNERGAGYDVCLIDHVTDEFSKLTSVETKKIFEEWPFFYNPSPSLNGNLIVFNTDRSNGTQTFKQEIVSINTDDSQFKRLTNNNFRDVHPIVGKLFYYK